MSPRYQIYFKAATKVGLTRRPICDSETLKSACDGWVSCILKDTSHYNEDYKQKHYDHECILPSRS